MDKIMGVPQATRNAGATPAGGNPHVHYPAQTSLRCQGTFAQEPPEMSRHQTANALPDYHYSERRPFGHGGGAGAEGSSRHRVPHRETVPAARRVRFAGPAR